MDCIWGTSEREESWWLWDLGSHITYCSQGTLLAIPSFLKGFHNGMNDIKSELSSYPLVPLLCLITGAGYPGISSMLLLLPQVWSLSLGHPPVPSLLNSIFYAEVSAVLISCPNTRTHHPATGISTWIPLMLYTPKTELSASPSSAPPSTFYWGVPAIISVTKPKPKKSSLILLFCLSPDAVHQ